jgi:hypothetical protein
MGKPPAVDALSKELAPGLADRLFLCAVSTLSAASLLLFANTGHHVTDDEFNLLCGERERITIRNDSNGFPGTVYDNLAGLAFLKVRLKAGPEFGTGGIVQVVTKLG